MVDRGHDSSMSVHHAVLVADAKTKVARDLTSVLKEKALPISSVAKPAQFATVVEKDRPDLILADVGILGRNRVGVLSKVHRLAPTVPMILVLTEGAADTAVLHALGSSVVLDFLLSPFSVTEARLRLERTLERIEKRSPDDAAEAARDALRKALHHPESGRLDAARIASYLDVTLKDFAAAVGDGYKALHKTPAKASIQPALVPIARILDILVGMYGKRVRVRAWLHTPHPDLGGTTPMSLLLHGKADVVRDMLEAALAGIAS